MNNQEQEIGIAELEYDALGKLTRSAFMSTMELTDRDSLLKSFVAISCKAGEEKIKEQACNVLSAWFQRNNDIELADQEKYQIVSEFVSPCEYWPDSEQIKKVSIKFIFKQIN